MSFKKLFYNYFIFIYANRSIANTVNIIYTVDNNPITNVEINNEITYLKLLSKEFSSSDRQLELYDSENEFEMALRSLIDRKFSNIAKKYVNSITQDAIEIGAKVIWTQEGVIDEESSIMAENAGIIFVMDECPKKILDN